MLQDTLDADNYSDDKLPSIPLSPSWRESEKNPPQELSSSEHLPIVIAPIREGSHLQEGDGVVYELLSDSADDSDLLFDFLKELKISPDSLESLGISEVTLRRLFQQEVSCAAPLKWSSFDHIAEKLLQWALLSPDDMKTGAAKSRWSRLRPKERSILLESGWGLIKAYTARGFVKGIESSLTESVYYFVYAMLAYRTVEWAQSGHPNYQEFREAFSGLDQKGIDTLVRSLAALPAQWLELILATPFIIGAFQGVLNAWSARELGAKEIQSAILEVHNALDQPGGWWRSGVREYLPLIAQIDSISISLQKLERLVRWDGRLLPEHRRQAFDAIRRAARTHDKMIQWNAMECLAKIAHGIGLKDILHLSQARYDHGTIETLLTIKTLAIADLTALTAWPVKESDQPPSKGSMLAAAPRMIYASYLLWWLGLADSLLKQRLPFSIMKAFKFLAELAFLQKIVSSIIRAIQCPDKSGFQFGDGYQDWASDYTIECFAERISIFREINISESVANLVAEIPQYHLADFTDLDLTNKYLILEEATDIVQAVRKQGANLQALDLSYNKLTSINSQLLTGLTQLQLLDLSENSLSSLNKQVLAGLSELRFLDLSMNQLLSIDDEAFSNLNQLQELDLSLNVLSNFNNVIFSGLFQLKTLNLDVYFSYPSVSNGAFSDLSNLETLSFCTSNDLDNTLFLNLSSLQTLSLSVQSNHLPPALFSNLGQLTSLTISGNALSSLDNEVFSGLFKLSTLRFYGSLTSLNVGIFSELNQLQELYLTENQLTSLSPSVFSELNQLRLLNLGSNLMTTPILLGFLPSLSSTLTALDISHNDLASLPEDFAQQLPASLINLNVGENPFIPKVLTSEFMSYFPTRLIFFLISESGITHINNNAFSNFLFLNDLELGGNELTSLNEGIFANLTQLKNLYLSGNKIRSMDDEIFSGLINLRSLQLDGNELSHINEKIFSGLFNLRSLELDHNHIMSISENAFSDLYHLQELIINTNLVSSLEEGLFTGLSQLNFLDFSDNLLSDTELGAFSGLNQLQTLWLNGNNLTHLSSNLFANLTQLNSLYLGWNQLSKLDIGVFSYSNKIETLVLNNNLIDDESIQNITRSFPESLSYFDISYNLIGNEGLQFLGDILPCTNLTTFILDGNLANDSSLALVAQQNALKKVCDDELCHTNLASQSCEVSGSSVAEAKISLGIETVLAIEPVPEIESLYSNSFYLPYFTEIKLDQVGQLPGPSEEVFLTSQAMAGMILGMAALSILCYKHSNLIQAVGGKIYQFWQWTCGSFTSEKPQEQKLARNGQALFGQSKYPKTTPPDKWIHDGFSLT